MSTNLLIILICNNIYASLFLPFLPFSFLNPPFLPVIIYSYISLLFILLLFPLHPIYLLSYLHLYSYLPLSFSPSLFLYFSSSLPQLRLLFLHLIPFFFPLLLSLRVISSSLALLSISPLLTLSNISSFILFFYVQITLQIQHFHFLTFPPFHIEHSWRLENRNEF